MTNCRHMKSRETIRRTRNKLFKVTQDTLTKTKEQRGIAYDYATALQWAIEEASWTLLDEFK